MKAHYDDVSIMDKPGELTFLVKNKRLVYSYDIEELLSHIDADDFCLDEILWNIRYQWENLVFILSLNKMISQAILKKIERDFLVRSYFAKMSLRFYKEMKYRISLLDMNFELDKSLKKIDKLSRMIKKAKGSVSQDNPLRHEIESEVYFMSSEYEFQKRNNTSYSPEVFEHEDRIEYQLKRIQRKLDNADRPFLTVRAPR